MKKYVLFCGTVLVYLFLSCLLVHAATILSDAQIEEISAIAEASGGAAQVAEDVLAGVAADLVAQGFFGEALSSKISIAIQEIISGLSVDRPDFKQLVNDIMTGASSGVVLGVNQAVAADPNFDAGTLTKAVVNGAARAALSLQANNPTLDLGQLVAAVNTGVVSQGGTPVEPEDMDPAIMPVKQNVHPPLTPQGELSEPPIYDDRAGSPV